MPAITYFFAAHSAFAYLGSARFYEIAEKAGQEKVICPLDLGKVVPAVHPNGFAARSKAHRDYYFGHEIERRGELRGVAFKGGIPANPSNDVTLANCANIAGSRGCCRTGNLPPKHRRCDHGICNWLTNLYRRRGYVLRPRPA